MQHHTTEAVVPVKYDNLWNRGDEEDENTVPRRRIGRFIVCPCSTIIDRAPASTVRNNLFRERS